MGNPRAVAYPPSAYPPYPYPPAPVRPPRRLRGPVILGVVGLVVGVLGILMWVGAAVLFGDAVSSASDAGERVRDELVAEIDVPGEAEVELDTGTYSVFAFVPSDARDGTATTTTSELSGGPGLVPDLDVTVTAADGTSLLVDETTFRSTWTDSDGATDLVEVAEVEVRQPGTYTVTVADAAGAQPAEGAGIGPEADYSEALGKGLGGGLLVVLGFLVGGLGALILLIALIWLLVAAVG